MIALSDLRFITSVTCYIIIDKYLSQKKIALCFQCKLGHGEMGAVVLYHEGGRYINMWQIWNEIISTSDRVRFATFFASLSGKQASAYGKLKIYPPTQ